MAILLTTHRPIIAVGTISGNQESINSYLEAAGQTFNTGTPVKLNVAGNVVAWDGATITRDILGITNLPGANLATAGAGASPNFGSIGFPGGSPLITPAPPNQPAAVNIPQGSPFVTGLSNITECLPDTIFEAQTDASAGAVFAPTTALIGTQLGLTIDANGFWFVDLGKNTVGVNTVLTIKSINPLDLVVGSVTTGLNNARVRFQFNIAASQLIGS